jgi:hypothetical protein
MDWLAVADARGDSRQSRGLREREDGISALPRSVKRVKAFIQSAGGRFLIDVPEDSYTVSTQQFGSVTATIITLSDALSKRTDLSWDDQIYITFKGTVGPNTIHIPEHLMWQNTDFGADAALFDAVCAPGQLGTLIIESCIANDDRSATEKAGKLGCFSRVCRRITIIGYIGINNPLQTDHENRPSHWVRTRSFQMQPSTNPQLGQQPVDRQRVLAIALLILLMALPLGQRLRPQKALTLQTRLLTLRAVCFG